MGVKQREIRVSRVRVVFDGEGEEGRPVRGARLPNGAVALRVEAAALEGREGWIFDPELEFAVDANGGEQVGVDGGREPL